MTTDARRAAVLNQAYAEWEKAQREGKQPDPKEFANRYPDIASELEPDLSNDRAAWHILEVLRQALLISTSSEDELPSIPWRLGPYEIVELIGAGGMGVVYKARDPELDRHVALKTLQDSHVNERGLARFRQESESAAKVEHPGIVPVYDVGSHEGQLYYTMRLVEGSNLQAMLDTLGENQRQAAELVARVAEAVGEAHRAGVIHRDLKPSNILLDAANTPYVADFGLAKSVEADRLTVSGAMLVEANGLTVSGAVLGTFQYMAPEQARDARNASPASDVYSLGVILYQVLTGRLPSTRRVIKPNYPRQRNRQPVDRQLAAVCLKCLERPPEARYEDALELAKDLRRFLEGKRVVAEPPRRWWWLALIAVVVGLNLFLSIVFGLTLCLVNMNAWNDLVFLSILFVSSVGALILTFESQSRRRRLSASKPRKWWWRALITVVVGLNLLPSIMVVQVLLFMAFGSTAVPVDKSADILALIFAASVGTLIVLFESQSRLRVRPFG